MSITYYPDEVFKMRRHVVEQLQQPNMLYKVFGTQDLSSAALSAGIWSPIGWEVRRVCLGFDSSSNKDYTVSIVHGIGISTGKNDPLRDEGQSYAKKLKEAGVPCVEVCYPGMMHCFSLFPIDFPEKRDVINRIKEMLHRD